MSEEYGEIVRACVLADGGFVRAVFSGQGRGPTIPWQRVTLRPVMIRGERHLQFSYWDGRQDVTKNYLGQEAAERLAGLLALPFRNIHLFTADQETQIRFTKRGKAYVHRRAHEGRESPTLEHDRTRELLLPVGKPDAFLIAMGVTDRQGRVRPRMRRKFRQINEFLRLVVSAGAAEIESAPLQVVDCGCGNAYLSFGVYHYFSHLLGRPTSLTGIDVNRALIERCRRLSAKLGWADLAFEAVSIVEYEPKERPDVVLALHACDTATDEALCQAVRWQSEMIFAAPCCHHDLQQQMDGRGSPVPFQPVWRHGILRDRFGDIMTDALRAPPFAPGGRVTPGRSDSTRSCALFCGSVRTWSSCWRPS